jgi:hypothetical protein
MVDVVAGLAAIKNGFQIAKSIAELVKQPELDRNELCSRVLLLQELMLGSQEALNDAQEEHRRLKEQIVANDRTREIEQDLDIQEDGHFYVRRSEKEKGVIPYCQACWGTEHNLVALISTGKPGAFICPIHKATHYTKAYEDYVNQQRESMRRANRPPGGPNSWMGS